MRILYVASDQTLPGATGGSVHVHEVSRALGLRGHEVHAVVDDRADGPQGEGYRIHRIRWSPHHRFFRYRARPRIAELIREIGPDAVMERYYNFGGEGILEAAAAGVPSLLEVNSPVIDHPGSLKAALDAALLARPMRRYRERIVANASALISPLREIVPEFVRERTHTVTWGANVEAFHPARRSAARRAAWGAHEEDTVVLFSGSHRPWHGVSNLEAAASRLRHRRNIVFVFAGGGREGPARTFNGRFLGRVPYGDMPEVTASADLSVAPYDRTRLASLALGFFWSPLKIFEALASGVPVVTLDIPPLNTIVRGDREGRFCRENDPEDLARVIEGLADDRAARQRMGEAARLRAPLYSWAPHAAEIERILEGLVSKR